MDPQTTQTNEPSVLISVKNAAEVYSIPASTLYFYAQKGIIPSVKFGRGKARVLFLRTSLDAWLRNKAEKSLKSAEAEQ